MRTLRVVMEIWYDVVDAVFDGILVNVKPGSTDQCTSSQHFTWLSATRFGGFCHDLLGKF